MKSCYHLIIFFESSLYYQNKVEECQCKKSERNDNVLSSEVTYKSKNCAKNYAYENTLTHGDFP